MILPLFVTMLGELAQWETHPLVVISVLKQLKTTELYTWR